MSAAAYRASPARPRVVLVAPAALRLVVLAFALIALGLGATFVYTSRVTLSCQKLINSLDEPIAECHADVAATFRHHVVDVKPLDTRAAVRVVQQADGAHVFVGPTEWFVANVDEPELQRAARDALAPIAKGGQDYAVSRGGGTIVDGRVVAAAAVVALLCVLASLRRHRLVVDRERGTIRAGTHVALLPWVEQKATLRAGDRIVSEREGNRLRVLLVSGDARTLLLETEARAALEELARAADLAVSA